MKALCLGLALGAWLLMGAGQRPQVAATARPIATPTFTATVTPAAVVPVELSAAARALTRAQSRLLFIQADFKMTVDDAKTAKPFLNASGEVWLANERRYRVQYQTPQRQLLVSNGHQRWLYLQAINQVQLQALPPQGNPTEFFLELGGGLARLVKHARVTRRQEGNLEVYTLIPESGQDSLYKKAVLWTKGKNSLPVKLMVLAERRVQVSFELKQVKLAGENLTASEKALFQFQIPKDAEVIEMLAPMP